LEHFSLRLESTAQQLDVALGWLNSLYRDEIPYQTWLEFQTAFGEAFDNAVRHAHRSLPMSTPVDLEVVIAEGTIVLKVWDLGPGFDFEAVLANLPEHQEALAESGRGFCILRRVADHLSYCCEPNRGNCLMIMKRYDRMEASAQA
jgi:anti-sigma regulatory factor (Ser/Thr protein kinase)